VLGRVNDFKRIHYFQTHINEVIKAKNEGANVQGYFAWSLIDNFEWAEGYQPRFGLIYVDFITKKRILKESAYWFRRHLNSSLYA
jgi:beta-glucosidase